MEYTKGELSTGYNNLIREFVETYWKPSLDKFQLATILELFLKRTSAPDLYEACKTMANFLYGYSESEERVSTQYYPKFKELYRKGYKALAKAEGKE